MTSKQESSTLPYQELLSQLLLAKEGEIDPSLRQKVVHALRHPAGLESALSRAVRATLYSYLEGKPIPPIDFDVGLRYTEGCRLALLGILANSPGAIAFAEKLLSWGTPPFAVGCREGEYDEALQIQAHEALLRKVGKSPTHLIDRQQRLVASGSRVFTLAGDQTPMGSFGAVRAMGPQVGTDRFGIDWKLKAVDSDQCEAGQDSCRLRGWTRCKATWIELEIDSFPKLTTIRLRPQEDPIFFQFYVKGDRCCNLAKKSLQHYRGPLAEVACDELVISLAEPLNVDVIPLAGEGAFWNADFLISFTLPKLSGWTQFKVIE